MTTFFRDHLDLLKDVTSSSIEILILTVAIYSTWKLFRGTRGARVLAGFGFVLATLSLLSKALHLTEIENLLTDSSALLLTALVIIFQPELRRMFAEVGSRQILGAHRQQTEVIQSVISAIEQMQQHGHGALIAF